MNKYNTYISFDFGGTLAVSEKLQNLVQELKQKQYHFGITTRRTNIVPMDDGYNREHPYDQVMDFALKHGIKSVNFVNLGSKAGFFRDLTTTDTKESFHIIHIDDKIETVKQINKITEQEPIAWNTVKAFHVSELLEFVELVRSL